MKIVVIGSGGVGGYFGAKLARGGEDVHFVARGLHLQAMRENGLCIRSAVDGEWRVKVPVTETLAGHPRADLVLFCVKSCDTEEAAELARPVVGPGTGILSLQNGLDNEDKLARFFDAEQVIGGVSYVFASIEAPGIIAHHQLGRIVFGEMHGQTSQRCADFLDACRRASIPAEVAPDIRKVLWEKFVFLVALAGTTAMTRLPVKFIQALPQTRRLWQLQVEESLALARVDGTPMDRDMMQRCGRLLESLAPANYSSLYQDLVHGRRLELDALHGHAIRLGARYGIPTPTLFAVYASLLPYADGRPVLPLT